MNQYRATLPCPLQEYPRLGCGSVTLAFAIAERLIFCAVMDRKWVCATIDPEIASIPNSSRIVPGATTLNDLTGQAFNGAAIPVASVFANSARIGLGCSLFLSNATQMNAKANRRNHDAPLALVTLLMLWSR